MQYEDDIEKLISAGFSRRKSSSASIHNPMIKDTSTRRVLVMGGRRVGKSSIISQFIQEKLPQCNKPTVQKMHQVSLRINNRILILNIEEICEEFACDFPAMLKLSLDAADAVIIVYAGDDLDTFKKYIFNYFCINTSPAHPCTPFFLVAKQL